MVIIIIKISISIYVQMNKRSFSCLFFSFLPRQTVAKSSLRTEEQLHWWEDILARIYISAEHFYLSVRVFLFAQLSPPHHLQPSSYCCYLFAFSVFFAYLVFFLILYQYILFCYGYSSRFSIFNPRCYLLHIKTIFIFRLLTKAIV